jgi:hypothetical protein
MDSGRNNQLAHLPAMGEDCPPAVARAQMVRCLSPRHHLLAPVISRCHRPFRVVSEGEFSAVDTGPITHHLGSLLNVSTWALDIPVDDFQEQAFAVSGGRRWVSQFFLVLSTWGRR